MMQVASGEAAREADGGHGRFGAGIDQPHHFDGGDGVADRLGESISCSVGAPKLVPMARARSRAATISGWRWPSSSGPQEPT